MNCDINWSAIGLIVDMIGVLILFEYGLPSKIIEPGGLSLGEDLTPQEVKFNKRVRFMAIVGLVFLFTGFVLQFIGSVV